MPVASYKAALDRLNDMGLVYRCWCTRSEIAEALKHKPVRHGPDGPVDQRSCKGKVDGAGDFAWRLDMERVLAGIGSIGWTDLIAGPQIADPMLFGDVILWRKDAPASYHLAAILDDAADGISHAVRGMDLFAYTVIHRLLQVLLGLPEPVYWHHPLLLDEKGDKLAKSRLSKPLAELRAEGISGIALVDQLRQGKLPLGISVATP